MGSFAKKVSAIKEGGGRITKGTFRPSDHQFPNYQYGKAENCRAPPSFIQACCQMRMYLPKQTFKHHAASQIIRRENNQRHAIPILLSVMTLRQANNCNQVPPLRTPPQAGQTKFGWFVRNKTLIKGAHQARAPRRLAALPRLPRPNWLQYQFSARRT